MENEMEATFRVSFIPRLKRHHNYAARFTNMRRYRWKAQILNFMLLIVCTREVL